MKKNLQFMLLGIPAALLMAGCNQSEVSFAKDVKPIIDQHCVECHTNNGKGTVASGFVVDNYESLMKGTKFGPVVVAGDPLSSSLYRLVSGEVDKSIQMPHNKDPLSPDKIAKIEQWIAQGAKKN